MVAFSSHFAGYNSTVAGRYNGALGGADVDLNYGNYTSSFNYVYGGCNMHTNGYYHVGLVAGTYLNNYGNYQVCTNCITKVSGSFVMRHPDPAKYDTMDLYHNFVESPNEGDNFYRYQITAQNCSAVLQLPDYFKYLNKFPQVKVAPKNHFGNGYGVVDETLSCVTFTTNQDGEYNVLIIGTRKDEKAVGGWSGVERLKYDSHPKVVGVSN